MGTYIDMCYARGHGCDMDGMTYERIRIGQGLLRRLLPGIDD